LNHKFYIKSTNSVRLVQASVILHIDLQFYLFFICISIITIYLILFFKIGLELIIYKIIRINGKWKAGRRLEGWKPNARVLETQKKFRTQGFMRDLQVCWQVLGHLRI
jgi:hypothetical protein